MIQASAIVTSVETDGFGPFVRMTLATSPVRPSLSVGRFLLADLGGLLRTPLFPARLNADGFEILALPDDAVAGLGIGDQVQVAGPLGRGFGVPPHTQHLLLVADWDCLPVLLPLIARPAADDRQITLLLAAPSADLLYPVRLLPPSLEVYVTMSEGSGPASGGLPGLFADFVAWADHVCIATDRALYPELAAALQAQRVAPARTIAEALVVPQLACGVGACQGCAVETNHGLKLACKDGPVFRLLDLCPE